MALMGWYDGYCRGGPWDGKQYAAHESTFVIEEATMDMRDHPKLLEKPLLKPVSRIMGSYHHVAGQWIWHPTETS